MATGNLPPLLLLLIPTYMYPLYSSLTHKNILSNLALALVATLRMVTGDLPPFFLFPLI